MKKSKKEKSSKCLNATTLSVVFESGTIRIEKWLDNGGAIVSRRASGDVLTILEPHDLDALAAFLKIGI